VCLAHRQCHPAVLAPPGLSCVQGLSCSATSSTSWMRVQLVGLATRCSSRLLSCAHRTWQQHQGSSGRGQWSTEATGGRRLASIRAALRRVLAQDASRAIKQWWPVRPHCPCQLAATRAYNAVPTETRLQQHQSTPSAPPHLEHHTLSHRQCHTVPLLLHVLVRNHLAVVCAAAPLL
jgi:hypothetical protein